MNRKISKLIIKELCIKFNLTEEQGLSIVKSQFRKVRKVIESYNKEEKYFPSIRLFKWGIFFVKPSKKKDDRKTDKPIN